MDEVYVNKIGGAIVVECSFNRKINSHTVIQARKLKKLNPDKYKIDILNMLNSLKEDQRTVSNEDVASFGGSWNILRLRIDKGCNALRTAVSV